MKFFRLALIISALPNTISNGQTADATPLMADLNHIVNQVNANAAELADVAQLDAANSFTAIQSGIAATSPSNFPIASQVQDNQFGTLSSVAGNNTITARVSGMTLTGYARGQLFTFVPLNGNSGAATINIDGVGAQTLYRSLTSTPANNLLNLSSDDLVPGKVALIRRFTAIDAQGTGFQLLNPNTNQFQPGTQMVFYNTIPPVGWTAVAINDHALRIVTSGTTGGTAGGADNFSTLFGTSKSTAGFTLTTTEIPSHTHSIDASSSAGTDVALKNAVSGAAYASGATGGGGSHSHTLNNMNLLYADVIVARKN